MADTLKINIFVITSIIENYFIWIEFEFEQTGIFYLDYHGYLNNKNKVKI